MELHFAQFTLTLTMIKIAYAVFLILLISPKGSFARKDTKRKVILGNIVVVLNYNMVNIKNWLNAIDFVELAFVIVSYLSSVKK